MRTESEKTQLRVFIIGLAVVAFVINLFFVGREHSAQISRKVAQAAQKEAESAAAEKAGFLGRFINVGINRKSGRKAAAIAVASEDGKPNLAVSAALASHLQTERVEMLSSFLKPEFIYAGLLDDAFRDSSALAAKLELSKFVDALLLARQSVQYSTDPSLENVITATMKLEVLIKSPDGNDPGRIWTFRANGAGFKQSDARSLAEERIIRQISTDTKMSFTVAYLKRGDC